MATATRPGPFARKSDRRPRQRGQRRLRARPQALRRGPRPHRAGHRRGDRHRHLRHHRRGHRRCRAVDHHLLRPGGRHVPVLGLLLRRAGLVDPGLGQRLHLRLRDARRARGVDHRLGPDTRVRRVGGRGGRRLGRLPAVAAGLALRDQPAATRSPALPATGGTVNLPAVFLVLAVAALLMYGVRESARTNTFMVFVKIAILIFFIVVGVGSINGDNFSPWAPHGFNGTVDAAALIFFAYIGFDAISTSGEEAENPSRDLPFAIIGALLICTLLYIVVAVVTVGLAPASKLAGSDAPLADALRSGAGVGELGGRHPLGGRADRHHERDADRALRPDADHVRDEPRRPRAALGGQVSARAARRPASPPPSASSWRSSPPSCRCRRSPSWSTSGRSSPS